MNRRQFGLMSASALVATAAAGRSLAPVTHAQANSSLFETGYHGDLAIINASIWTMDPDRPRASAALVRGGRIVYIGSSADVRARGRGVRHFDAAGRTVVPGFIDSHTHFETACQYYDSLHLDIQVPPIQTLSQLLDTVRNRAATTTEGRWIIGRSSFSFDSLLREKRYPTRLELDAISQAHPIVVLAGLHCAMLNTVAFKALGLWTDHDTRSLRWKDGRPRIGTDVARDSAGVPSGVATEIYDLIPASAFTPEERRHAIKTQVGPQFTSKGLTSVVTMPFCGLDLVADLQLQREGALPLRLRTYPIVPQLVSLESLLDCAQVAGEGNDLYRFGGIKLFVAGAGQDAYGKEISDLKWTQAELNDVVYRAQCAEYQVLMHEEGHESFELALNAVENAQRLIPRNFRHRLEHYGELETIEEMARVRNAGMRVTLYVPGYRDPEYRPLYASLIREGLQPVAISDATGTMPAFGPLLGIASIVAPPSEGGFAPPGEVPSVEDAFRMCTSWAASAQFEERDKGSVAVGKLGDFAVLSRDISTSSAAALFDVTVDATILGGQVVYER